MYDWANGDFQTRFDLARIGSCCRALTLVFVLASAGCAGFQPVPVAQTTVIERASTRTQSELSVTVSVPSIEEARKLFDSKLHKKRIQPLWIEIENHGDRDAWFFAHSIDRDYFPPLEVAWRSHRTWARKTNRKIDAYLYEQAMPARIPPSGSASGFVFVHLDRGTKYVPLDVIRENDVQSFEFILEAPGFAADHKAIDFESLYAEDGFTDLSDEQAVRSWAEALPCCVRNKKNTTDGDPLNFVLVGSDAAFATGFLRARWDETAEMTGGSKMRIASAAVFGKTYRNAPISPLYVLERPQDIGLQKGRKSIHQRNHLRLWLAPVTFRGDPVWIGQISRDIGSKLTTKSSTLTTHKIDPDVDDSRDVLLLDLIEAGVIETFGYASGVGEATPEEPRQNLTADPYFTDGLRLVMFLTEERTSIQDVRYLEWALPAE